MSDHEPHYPSLIPKAPPEEDADDTVVLPTDNTGSCLCGHDPHHGPCRAGRCRCEDYRPVGFADLALDPNDPAVAAMKRLYELEQVPDEVVAEAKAALDHVNQLEEEAIAMSASVDPTDPGAVAVPAEVQPEPEPRSPALERAMARVRETSPVEAGIVDRELSAMQVIVTALDRLDDGGRTRVIRWAWSRWG